MSGKSGIVFKNPEQAVDKGLGGTRRIRGAFAEYPVGSPRYLQASGFKSDYRDTMARLFVAVSPAERKQFLASVAEEDPEAAYIGEALVGGSETATGQGYVEFLLQSAQHGLKEKLDVQEFLADNFVVYTFGHMAPIFSYSGVLLNTVQDNQSSRMLRIYQSIIRASMLSKRRKLVQMNYDGMVVAGVLEGFNWSLTAEMETAVAFNFSIIVSKITLLPDIEPPANVYVGTKFPDSVHEVDDHHPEELVVEVPDVEPQRVLGASDPSVGVFNVLDIMSRMSTPAEDKLESLPEDEPIQSIRAPLSEVGLNVTIVGNGPNA